MVPILHVEEGEGDDDSQAEEDEEEGISDVEEEEEEEEVERMPGRTDGPSAGLVEGEDGGTEVVVDPDGSPSPTIETSVVEEEEGDSEEESDDEDSEEDDDDDDEEEEEPTLKYSRLGGEGIVELLSKDSVSSVAVSDHVIVSSLPLLISTARQIDCCFVLSLFFGNSGAGNSQWSYLRARF